MLVAYVLMRKSLFMPGCPTSWPMAPTVSARISARVSIVFAEVVVTNRNTMCRTEKACWKLWYGLSLYSLRTSTKKFRSLVLLIRNVVISSRMSKMCSDRPGAQR